MSKTQVLVILGSLLIGAFVCSGVLSLTLGTTGSLFWPALGATMTIVAIVVVLTQRTRKRQ